MQVERGAVVRHRSWGGRFVGTVTRRDGDLVVVAWYGSCVEDELDVGEVELIPDPPADLAGWRGGLGADGSWRIEAPKDRR